MKARLPWIWPPHIRQLGGTFRIPQAVRSILRAAIHEAGQDRTLLRDPDGDPLGSRRMAHRIRRAADHAGLAVPPAGQRASTSWDAGAPFAAAFTRTVRVTPLTEPGHVPIRASRTDTFVRPSLTSRAVSH